MLALFFSFSTGEKNTNKHRNPWFRKKKPKARTQRGAVGDGLPGRLEWCFFPRLYSHKQDINLQIIRNQVSEKHITYIQQNNNM